MTLDEAIRHAEEVSESLKDEGTIEMNLKLGSTREQCLECSDEHRQLAEWLKDYKRLKSLHHEYTDRTQKHRFFYYEDSASAEIQVRTFPADKWVFTKTRAPRMSKEEFIRWCMDWEDSRA